MFIFKGRTIWSVLAPFAVLGLLFLLTGNTRAGSPGALQAQGKAAAPAVIASGTAMAAARPRYIAQVN